VSESEWVAMGGDKGLVGMSACGRVPIVWAQEWMEMGGEKDMSQHGCRTKMGGRRRGPAGDERAWIRGRCGTVCGALKGLGGHWWGEGQSSSSSSSSPSP